jgi:hypothetical protein
LTADWRTAPCSCLLCLFYRLSPSLPPLAAEAAGTYIVTRTHTSAWPVMCHPDGCPSDPRARQRIAAQEMFTVPGARPRHTAGSTLQWCERVACARLPEQQRRRALGSALAAVAYRNSAGDPFAALRGRAKRSKRPETLEDIEHELRDALYYRLGEDDSEPPVELHQFPSLLAGYSLHLGRVEDALEGARSVAEFLPLRRFPAIENLVAPEYRCEVRARDWPSLLERSSLVDGVLPLLLRSPVRQEAGGLVFIVAGEAVPWLAWAWTRARTDPPCFALDAAATAWAERNIPRRPADDWVWEDGCLAIDWWLGTFGDDSEADFPLAGRKPGCVCAAGRHVNAGDVHADGSVTTDVSGAVWRIDEQVPDGCLVFTSTETDINTGKRSDGVSSNMSTFLKLCCDTHESSPMDAIVSAVSEVIRAFRPEPVQATVTDLVDEQSKVRAGLVPYRVAGALRVRVRIDLPPVIVPRTETGLLPRGFEGLLKQRRPTRVDAMVQAWRMDAPWGIYGGPDLTPAATESPEAWTPELDALLLRLAAQYSGFAPSVFAATTGGRFPALEAGAQGSPLIARSVHGRFPASDAFGPVAALVFSRMLALTEWSMPVWRTCPLCGDQFDPLVCDPRHVVQYGPVRWCSSCLSKGWGSAVASREEALASVAHLAHVLGSVPPREWSRQPVPHGIPHDQRDRVVAARMAMPDNDSLRRLGLTSWGETLMEAEVVLDGVRTARGFASRASDGHWCRSLLELAVDDFFTSMRIAHECEPGWPYHAALNPNAARRADWRLADGTFVEAAGLMDDKGYAEKMSQKQLLAEALGIPLIVVEPSDLNRLDVLFAAWTMTGSLLR